MKRYTRNSSTASGRATSFTRPQRRAAASSLANHHCPSVRPTYSGLTPTGSRASQTSPAPRRPSNNANA